MGHLRLRRRSAVVRGAIDTPYQPPSGCCYRHPGWRAKIIAGWAKSRNGMRHPTGAQRARDRGEDGFTLLELLVVIVIIGLLIGLVAPAVLRQLGNARTSVAQESVARLGSVLDLYKLDVGSYPSSGQGLEALLQRPAGVELLERPLSARQQAAARSLEPSLCLSEPGGTPGPRLRPLLARTRRCAGRARPARHDLQQITPLLNRAPVPRPRW